MIKLITFSDIAKKIGQINKDSYLVKICVVVTRNHLICLDTENAVEFFRVYVDNTTKFMNQLHLLYWAMIHHDYEDVKLGTRVNKSNKRYSSKLFNLWKQANEKKLSKL